MSERRYGGLGTIHQSGEVNVELDKQGHVVSVWFRCMLLPFTERVVDKDRAESLRKTYTEYPLPPMTGVIFDE